MATGGNSGNNVGSIQLDIFKSHTHIQDAHSHSIPARSAQSAGGNSVSQGQSVLADTYHSTTSTTATNQYTGGSETRPINAYVNYIIKL